MISFSLSYSLGSLSNLVTLPFRVDFFLVDLKGFVCIFAPCGGRGKNRGSDQCLHWSQQPSTGRLPLGIRIPSAEYRTKKETHPFGWISFLVDLKGFEPSTPTMRMWCAPGPCVSRALFCDGICTHRGIIPALDIRVSRRCPANTGKQTPESSEALCHRQCCAHQNHFRFLSQ